VSFGDATLFFRNVEEVARAATMLTDYCQDQVVLPSTDDILDARQRIVAHNKTILDYFKTPHALQFRQEVQE
jgi:ketosteroid isomerase-like protein